MIYQYYLCPITNTKMVKGTYNNGKTVYFSEDADNSEAKSCQEWVAEGNTIQEAD